MKKVEVPTQICCAHEKGYTSIEMYPRFGIYIFIDAITE